MPEKTRSRFAGLAAFARLPAGAVDVLIRTLSLGNLPCEIQKSQ
jgi:hypothetical protein